MTENKNRRRLIGGLLTGGFAAPLAWKRPVVEYVVLPAHALTSGTGCTPDPQSAIAVEGTGSDEDNVAIIFDGESFCVLETNDGTSDPDHIVSLDASATGGSAGTWTVDSTGGNWSVSGAPSGSQPSRDVELFATRASDPNAGEQCRVTFRVDIEQIASGPDQYEMTVSNVVIAPA